MPTRRDSADAAGSIADQAAGLRQTRADSVDRRNGMASLPAPRAARAGYRRTGRGRRERAGMQLGEGCEGGVDLAFGAGLQDSELQPFARAASCASVIMRSASAIVRVHEQGDLAGLGNQFGKQLEPLGRQLDG